MECFCKTRLLKFRKLMIRIRTYLIELRAAHSCAMLR